MSVCIHACVCLCVRERETEREREKGWGARFVQLCDRVLGVSVCDCESAYMSVEACVNSVYLCGRGVVHCAPVGTCPRDHCPHCQFFPHPPTGCSQVHYSSCTTGSQDGQRMCRVDKGHLCSAPARPHLRHCLSQHCPGWGEEQAWGQLRCPARPFAGRTVA
ncbi:hypothetical protein HJG60_009815 [Phyllostomus discolor]|uniref:Uncharacterized protein n=1 Tax=Phyllostomus discolor TaxID=89673 RepID=A0A834B2L4_9CHIR|nr:hypothetical protein HJG60_009815 [Phyllostomus discolor]